MNTTRTGHGPWAQATDDNRLHYVEPDGTTAL